MTCSRNLGRLLQVGCLGLIGMLAAAGCGGSDTKPPTKDGAPPDGAPKPQLAVLTATPATVVFNSVDVGKPSSTPVQIGNTGAASASLSIVAAPAGLIATSGCTAGVAANGNCTLTITVNPTVAGAFAGSVTVTPVSGTPISISVSGTAVPLGNFTLSPTIVPLGDIAVGDTVQNLVTVTALSNLTGLTFGPVGPNLKLDASSDCAATLAANASCKLVFNFTSATPGAATGDMIAVTQAGVTKYATITANVLTLAKLGAQPPILTLTAPAGQQGPAGTIDVGNGGGMPTGNVVVSLDPATAPFKVLTDTCSITPLPGNGRCALTVVYNPAAGATATEAALIIRDSGIGASTASVTLKGIPTGVANFAITGGPSLGSAAPGKAAAEVLFTVTATGATGVLNKFEVGNPNVIISSNACNGKSLEKGGTCTIGLTLSPPATAASQAISTSLTVTSADGSSAAIAITGAIVGGPKLTATPPQVSFGSIPVNQASTIQTVTVKNEGATATATLSVLPSGAGASQVEVVSNTCTVLAPNATCTFAVQYKPTDETGVNGTILVSDGTVSTSVIMVGTGLPPSPITVTTPKPVDFGVVLKGYPQTTQMVTVQLLPTSPSDSGAITWKITNAAGEASTEFTVDTTSSDCGPTLQPGQSCNLLIGFTASDLGARTGSLEIKGAKGGIYTVALKGTAVPLVELLPLPVTAGTDFGQAPNATGKLPPLQFRLVVRGSNTPAATSTVANALLTTPGTTPDFRNVDWNGTTATATNANRCDAATLGLTASTGEATGTAPANWSATTLATSATSPQVNQDVWVCDFYIQFYPQTGKSATPKTATLNATASGSGSATLALTGVSTGPLTINPNSYTFPAAVVLGGASETSTTISTTTTLTINPEETTTASFTVKNEGASGVQGPLTVALGGTNAAEFGIINDDCTGRDPLLGVGQSCVIDIIFVPSSIGQKTATVTVTAANSSEVASGTINANAVAPYAVTLTPSPTADLGSVAQANVGAWSTFTITNPAGAPLTGKLAYYLTGTDSDDFEIFNLTIPGASVYPATACGDSNTKQLAAGETCTVQVRFKPLNTKSAGTRTAMLVATVGGTPIVPPTTLTGTATAQLAVAGTDIAVVAGVPTIDFGKAANGVGVTKSLTVTNTGAVGSNPIILSIGAYAPSSTTPDPHYSIASTSVCTNGLSLAGGASCKLDLVYTGGAPEAAPVSGSLRLTNGTPNTGANVIYTKVTVTGQSVSPAVLARYGMGDYNPDYPIEMGAVALGANSGTLTLWFTNTGGVAATQLDKNIVQTAADFVVVAENAGTCFSGQPLVPGGICSVNVQFKPTSASVPSKAGELELFAAGVEKVTVKLHGTAIQTSNSLYAVVKDVTPTYALYTFGSTPTTGLKAYYQLHNNTTSPFTFTNLTVDNYVGNAADFAIAAETNGTGSACGATVPSLGLCIFSVTFQPTWDTTATNGRLYRWAAINANSAPILGVIGQVKKPAQLELTATSTATVTVTASAVNFGQIIPTESAALTFTITNSGEEATTAAPDLALAGTTGWATKTTTCTAALAPAATCTGTVTVHGALGNHTGGSVKAVAGAIESGSFDLAVNVVDPATLSMAAAGATTFSSAIRVGSTSTESLAITVTNGTAPRQTSGPLVITLSDSTNFRLSTSGSDNCVAGADLSTITLVGGDSCNIYVKLKPESVGVKTTKVSVTAAPGAATALEVTLTGTGLANLSITPEGTAAAPTGIGTTVAVFEVTNETSTATGLLRSTLGGANAAAFAILEDSCFGQRLLGGQTCLVVVKYVSATAPSPTAPSVGTLTVSDGVANNTAVAYFSTVVD